MLDVTHQFVEIEDGDVCVVKADQLQIYDSKRQLVTRREFTVNVDPSASDKGTYPYYMLKEIDEQPNVMRRLSAKYLSQDGQTVLDPKLLKAMANADRIYLVGAGTSYHAGLVGKMQLERLTGIPTEVRVASEFAYDEPLLSEHPFFIFLSQSGETADSRQVLVNVNQQHYPSLTITNVANSTLSREATFTLLLDAGPEISVASTKAYTAKLP